MADAASGREDRGERAAHRILYAVGPEAYRDGIIHAAAWSAGDTAQLGERAGLPDRWTAPKFPLGGRDIIGFGVSGAAVGAILRAVEAWWIAEDFAPDEYALRTRLQQMIAAQQ